VQSLYHYHFTKPNGIIIKYFEKELDNYVLDNNDLYPLLGRVMVTKAKDIY
jgi:hypothetical protein